MKERLDRVVRSSDWAIKFPKAGVTNLPIWESDHAPILMGTSKERERESL